MKKLTFAFVFLAIFSSSSLPSKLSPDLQIVKDLYSQGKVNEIKSMGVTSPTKEGNGEYIDVLAEFYDVPSADLLSKCSLIRKYPGSNNFYHLRIPISEVKNFEVSSSLKYMKLSRFSKLFLDKVREKIGIENFYNYSGIGDIQGKDVIIGIVDTGIDTSHWDFWKGSSVPRILYIWDQTTNGKYPQGFNYGREITMGDILANPLIGTDEEGHGTHVAGIAGGNGNESAGKYKGIAPSSEFVIVKTTLSTPDIIDGINYIMNKAKSLGKPCVINLSLGSDLGSHDGKDIEGKLLKDMINYYGEEGNIIVAAAGNSGDMKIHYSNTISSTSSVTATMRVETNIQNEADQIYIDSWFDFTIPGLAVEVKVTTPSGSTTGWLSFSTSSYSISTIDGKITVESVSNEYNGSGNIFIMISDSDSTQIKEGNWQISFRTTNGTTLIHSWMLTSDGIYSYFNNGDNYYTISSSFLLDDVITVGAFTTKTNIKSIYESNITISSEKFFKTYVRGYNSSSYGETIFANLTNDNVCYFSSLGPTRDGRQKPDIAAPGALVVSALSSSSYATIPFVVDEYPGKYKYIAMMGTSMAAPVVTGITALLLSIEKTLKPQDIINYLKTYSTASPYDSNGKSWDPAWGFGMLNITNLLQTLKSPTNLIWLEGNVLRFSWGINQFNIKIRTDTQDSVEVCLYNVRGALIKDLGIYQIHSGLNTIPIKIGENDVVKDNVYILKLYSKNGENREFKVVVLR